ncbi:hypothetical protein TeGR_g12696 [Tetraparma gracilis]|uniref:UNC-45/Cro1/She4 central domain-containing protein n=1 Tax=Tetraparma gracilis TaxID=2962635 RepID=A0ABQ6MG51_9STRA|nr:hypothetical protein TeGR_g12696 [Tetraparma gracilis]
MAASPPLPPSSLAFKELGTLAFKARDFPSAISHYLSALSTPPVDPATVLPVLSNLILCHLNAGDARKALAVSGAALAAVPSPFRELLPAGDERSVAAASAAASSAASSSSLPPPPFLAPFLPSLSASPPPSASLPAKICFNHLRALLSLGELSDAALKLALRLADVDGTRAVQQLVKRCVDDQRARQGAGHRLEEALGKLSPASSPADIDELASLLSPATAPTLAKHLSSFLPALSAAAALPLLPPLFRLLASLRPHEPALLPPLASLLHPLVTGQPDPPPSLLSHYASLLPSLPLPLAADLLADVLPSLPLPAATAALLAILAPKPSEEEPEKEPRKAMEQRQRLHAEGAARAQRSADAAASLVPAVFDRLSAPHPAAPPDSPQASATALSVLIDALTNSETTGTPSISDREAAALRLLSAAAGVSYSEPDPGAQDAPPPPVEVHSDLRTLTLLALLSSAGALTNDCVGEHFLAQLLPSTPALLASGPHVALGVAALSNGCKTQAGRVLVKGLHEAGVLQSLMQHEDAGVAATAVAIMAKIGFKDMAVGDEKDMMKAGLVLLEDPSSEERGIEILSYLCNKTTYKNVIAASPSALSSIVSCSAASGFGVATILSLLTVSIEQQRKEAFRDKEITEEQYKELQKLAMEKSSSEQEEMDPAEAVNRRISHVVSAGALRPLLDVVTTASTTVGAKEVAMLALVQIAAEKTVRGAMIQAGALKAAIELLKSTPAPPSPSSASASSSASSPSPKLSSDARFCIAKMLVTTNPSMLTDAQCMGSVLPLVNLVAEHTSTNLQQFEALLSLTNLGGSSPATKNHIVASGGLKPISYLAYSDHELVKRAAVECTANLLPHEKTAEYFTVSNNYKIWTSYARDYEEQFETARAAAGGLAMAVSDWDVKLAVAAMPDNEGMEWVQTLIESGNLELMHRAVVFVKNLLSHNTYDGEGEVPDKFVGLKEKVKAAVVGTKCFDTITVLAAKGDELCRMPGEEGGLGEAGEVVVLLCKEIVAIEEGKERKAIK